jgi:hypothetical protein
MDVLAYSAITKVHLKVTRRAQHKIPILGLKSSSEIAPRTYELKSHISQEMAVGRRVQMDFCDKPTQLT